MENWFLLEKSWTFLPVFGSFTMEKVMKFEKKCCGRFKIIIENIELYFLLISITEAREA